MTIIQADRGFQHVDDGSNEANREVLRRFENHYQSMRAVLAATLQRADITDEVIGEMEAKARDDAKRNGDCPPLLKAWALFECRRMPMADDDHDVLYFRDEQGQSSAVPLGDLRAWVGWKP